MNYKQQLLDNKKSIKVTDFGAGSKVFKNDEREVSKIVKVAGISNKKAKLLFKAIINVRKIVVNFKQRVIFIIVEL